MYLSNNFFAAHPWVREGGSASDIPLDISVLFNMRQFVKYSRLKQIALRVSLYLLHPSFLGIKPLVLPTRVLFIVLFFYMLMHYIPGISYHT